MSIIPSNIISLPDWIPFWKLRGSWTVSKTDLAIYDLDRAYTIKQNVWDGLNTASYPDYLRGDVKLSRIVHGKSVRVFTSCKDIA